MCVSCALWCVGWLVCLGTKTQCFICLRASGLFEISYDPVLYLCNRFEDRSGGPNGPPHGRTHGQNTHTLSFYFAGLFAEADSAGNCPSVMPNLEKAGQSSTSRGMLVRKGGYLAYAGNLSASLSLSRTIVVMEGFPFTSLICPAQHTATL